jgi:magnesium-protoporphyrin IX monomethyl ester (oxidative) cyclase
MNVVLFNPPAQFTSREDISILPPLGLLYIGAILEKGGHHVQIVDCMAEGWRHPQKTQKGAEVSYDIGIDDAYLTRLIKDLSTGVVGISCLFATAEQCTMDLARRIKRINNRIKVVVGGTNATVRYERLMQELSIDYIVLGEGDYVFNTFVTSIEKGEDVTTLTGLVYRDNDHQIHVTTGVNRVSNLDELPFPAYHLLANSVEEYFQGNFAGLVLNKRVLPVCTTRGCVINCVFCAGKNQFGIWRHRSPENVIAEIEYLKTKYNVKEIAFTDSNINVNKHQFVKFLNLMDERKMNVNWVPWGGIFIKTFSPDIVGLMKKTGCHSVYLSVEHGNLEMQKYIGKIVPLNQVKAIVAECRKYGIWTHGNFVLGLPGETHASINDCFDYAVKAQFDSVSFHIAIPLPGSRFYEEVKTSIDLNSQNLRFKTREITWSPLDCDDLSKTVKRMLVKFLFCRMLSELHPRSLVLRLRSCNVQSLKLLTLNMQKFFGLFFRLYR